MTACRHSQGDLDNLRSTFNQIDHIVIDGRYVCSVLDVRAFRSPNIDSNHYPVAAKFRLRICASMSARSSALRKLDVKKLLSQRTAEAFYAQLLDKLRRLICRTSLLVVNIYFVLPSFSARPILVDSFSIALEAAVHLVW